MKIFLAFTASACISFVSSHVFAQTSTLQATVVENTKLPQPAPATTHLYIDVHHLGAGNVNAKALAAAHQKDLAVEKKYGVQFINYWFDEAKGDVYCLSSAPNPEAIKATHAEAHGLLPDDTYQMTEGTNVLPKVGQKYFLDLHEFGAGNVSAKDVAGAHQKDLAVQKKYGVKFINYFVDEKKGTVMCLAQAPDSAALVNTHKEAHGLIPVRVTEVKRGK